ncbi:MAG: TolC family protein [Planctomycetota bacterium]|nr:TolC family protein [Planctomycetota bacterium]MDA1137291.1 TolC family protein [Planctomycetota bacterium]
MKTKLFAAPILICLLGSLHAQDGNTSTTDSGEQEQLNYAAAIKTRVIEGEEFQPAWARRKTTPDVPQSAEPDSEETAAEEPVKSEIPAEEPEKNEARIDEVKPEPESDTKDSALEHPSKSEVENGLVEELIEIAEVAGTPFSLRNSNLRVLQFKDYKPGVAVLSPQTSWISLDGNQLPMSAVDLKAQRKQAAEPTLPEQLENSEAMVADESVLRLDRSQMLQLLLQHNQQIEIAKVDWNVRQEGESAEWGAWEPSFGVQATRETNERDNSIEDTLSQFQNRFVEKNTRISSGVEGRAPTGASYRLGYQLNRLSNSLQSALNQEREPFDSEYTSFFGLSLTQPLLKNGWFSANLGPMRLAKKDVQIAYQSLRQQMIGTVARAESGYWDLALSQKAYELRTASVSIAEKILDDYQQRVATGKVSELELMDAEAGLAERKADQSAANRQLVELRNSIRSLFADTFINSNTTLVAADQPSLKDLTHDRVASIRSAFEKNPEYLARLREMERENIRVAIATNQRLPQIDLKGSYGLNGLGGDVSDSWQDISDSSSKSWSVGIEVSIPLGGGIRERHQKKAAMLRKQQALLNMKKAEVDLTNSIDTVINSIMNARILVETSGKRAGYSQRVLDVELVRFKDGKSDSRRVLEVEEDLFKSRLQELNSLISYEKSLVLLEAMQGSILENRKVRITQK